MAKAIYKITILNWEKYNSSKKKGHDCILLSTGFLSDAKIRQLTPAGVLLYLSCLLLAGESTSSQIEVSAESLCFHSRVKPGSLQSQIDELESLQLLTHEISLPLKNRIEKKSKEKKRIEVPTTAPTSASTDSQPELFETLPAAADATPPAPVKKIRSKLSNEESDLNRAIWESYRESYVRRWKTEPVRNVTVNGQVSSLRKRLGAEAVQVVAFYVSSNHSFYVGKCHPIGLCLADAESLRTQWANGKAITGTMLRDFEKRSATQETLDQINREYGVES